MNRTQSAGITLARQPRGVHTAKLPVLNAKRALKGVQLQASAPELEERQARLRENQSSNLVQRRKMVQAVVALINTRERDTEMGIGFFEALGQEEGKGRQSGRCRWEYRDARRGLFSC